MSGKFVSLVLIDREAQNIDDEWGRGFEQYGPIGK